MLGKRLFSPSRSLIPIYDRVLAHQRLLAFNVRPLSSECHISIYAPVCYRVVSRCRLINLFYIILYSNFLKRFHFLKNFFNFFFKWFESLVILYYIRPFKKYSSFFKKYFLIFFRLFVYTFIILR